MAIFNKTFFENQFSHNLSRKAGYSRYSQVKSVEFFRSSGFALGYRNVCNKFVVCGIKALFMRYFRCNGSPLCI